SLGASPGARGRGIVLREPQTVKVLFPCSWRPPAPSMAQAARGAGGGPYPTGVAGLIRLPEAAAGRVRRWFRRDAPLAVSSRSRAGTSRALVDRGLEQLGELVEVDAAEP